LDILDNSEIEDIQLQIREVKKISISGKRMRKGEPVTAYGRNRTVNL